MRTVLSSQLASAFTEVWLWLLLPHCLAEKMFWGQCIGMHPILGAGDSETDSVTISDLFLCVSESVLNECSYDAYKSADNIDIM